LQAPAAHVSPVVHKLPSLQPLPSGRDWNTQPPLLAQVSSVQGLPSSQAMPVPLHWPFWQLSLTVQALLSVQVAPFGSATFSQPWLGLQVSVVQGLPSPQAVIL
jgi:hypothetical protein